MENSPLFSILIANYNNGRFLIKAIESVKQQSYGNWEIIIVDDGSIDNSHNLYKEFEADSRIHIYLNDVNKGCGYTKRRCVELASGNWCMFVDPDDTICLDALQIFANEIKHNPQFGVFFSHMNICDSEMNVILNRTFQYGSKDWNQFIHYQKGIPLYCFNKDIYNKTDGINCNLPQSVDIDLYYKMAEQTETFYIDKALYNYRSNPISLTKNIDRATATHLKVIIDSMYRQGKNEAEIIQEIQGFYIWRIQPMRDRISYIENDVFFKLGQKLHAIKRILLRR